MSSPRSATVVFDSTTLANARYDEVHNQLQLQFRDGSRYLYHGVSPALFADLVTAPSQGSFFNRHIRGHFLHDKLLPKN